VADQRRLGSTSHHGPVYHYTSYWKEQEMGFNGERLSIARPTLETRMVNEDGVVVANKTGDKMKKLKAFVHDSR